jgi:hypothetical protein
MLIKTFVGRGFGAGAAILRVEVRSSADESGDGLLPSATTCLKILSD